MPEQVPFLCAPPTQAPPLIALSPTLKLPGAGLSVPARLRVWTMFHSSLRSQVPALTFFVLNLSMPVLLQMKEPRPREGGRLTPGHLAHLRADQS